MLTIMHALREWRNILISSSHDITVYTDHIGLKFFKEPQNLSYCHAQWSVELADFRMEIAYIKGSHNTIADALSRSPILDPEELKRDKVITLLPKEIWLPDGDMASISRIVSEPTERIPLLQQAHDHILAGHPGIAQTLRNLEGYSWQGKAADVEQYIKRCLECQRFKIHRNHPRGILHPLPPATTPFERISVDHISPLPLSDGFDAILVVVDFFTKYKIFIPCNTTDSSPDFVQHYLAHVFPHFGLPGSIVSDRGATFVSKFTKALWKQLSVKPLPSTAYHPQTNGQTEHANQELEQYLRFYCNYEQDNWSSLLPLAQFVFNSRFHSGVQNTSYFLMFGYTPRWQHNSLPSDNPSASDRTSQLDVARNDAIAALTKAAGIMKSYYDAKRDDLPPFEIGSKVWLESTNITPFRPMKKLAEKRYGPFEILEAVGPSAYRLKLPATWKGIHPVFNEILLLPFVTPLPSQSTIQPPPIIQSTDSQTYEVETILDTRKRRNKTFYLVKWSGYGHEENTWEPLSNLKDAKEALSEFWKTRD